MTGPDVAPYDALLLVSFGGPKRSEAVRPVPRERHARPRDPARAPRGGRCALLAVRRGVAHQRSEPSAARGAARPTWRRPTDRISRSTGATATGTPTSSDAAGRDEGGRRHARGLCSSPAPTRRTRACRQYRENLDDATAGGPRAGPRAGQAPAVLQPPGLRRADARTACSRRWPTLGGAQPRRLRVRHALDPDSRTSGSGPDRRGAYVSQHRSVAAADRRPGRPRTPVASHDWDLVFCSRGPARRHVPWLEPDVNDHLRALAEPARPRS